MSVEPQLDPADVRTHVGTLQSLIARMAQASASCKTWCVAAVSAILALAAKAGDGQVVAVGFVPVVALLLLDAYYLSIERDFRHLYDEFVGRWQSGDLTRSDLFSLKHASGPRHRAKATVTALKSIGVLPFYGALVLALIIACLVM